VVAFITGNGLKTLEAVEHEAKPVNIKATMSSFEELVTVPTKDKSKVGS